MCECFVMIGVDVFVCVLFVVDVFVKWWNCYV